MNNLKFSEIYKKSVIVNEDGKWKVKTKDRSKTLGEHDTKEEAERQLRAIEINKHKRKKSAVAPDSSDYVDPYYHLQYSYPISAQEDDISSDNKFFHLRGTGNFKAVIDKINKLVTVTIPLRKNYSNEDIELAKMAAYRYGSKTVYLWGLNTKRYFVTESIKSSKIVNRDGNIYLEIKIPFILVKNIEKKEHINSRNIFSSTDLEFNKQKHYPYDTNRNDWFQYEPAHGESAPVGGNSNNDMKGGFYTDLNLPDTDKKKKQLVEFEPSNHVNLHPSFVASLNTEFFKFRNSVLNKVKLLPSFSSLSDDEIDYKLYSDWIKAKSYGIL